MKYRGESKGGLSWPKRAALGILVGATALNNTGCSEPPHPQESSVGAIDHSGATESTPRGIDFSYIEKPVAILASPLTITPDAELRSKFPSNIDVSVSDPYYDDPAKDLLAAQEFIDSLVGNPAIEREARAFFDRELAQAATRTSGIHTYVSSDDWVARNNRAIDAYRGLADLITDPTVKSLTHAVVNDEIARQILNETGDLRSVHQGLLARLPEELGGEVMGVFSDAEKRYKLIEVLDDRKRKLHDELNATSCNSKGSAFYADWVNDDLLAYTDYRTKHPDEYIPGVKDLIMRAVGDIYDLDSAKLAAEEIKNIPEQFATQATEAKSFYDGQLYDLIGDKYIYDDKDITEMLELANMAHDPNTKQLLIDLTTQKSAVFYGGLPAPDDYYAERDTKILGLLENDELKLLATAARGGDSGALEKLEALVEATSGELGDIIGANIYLNGSELWAGSNEQANEVNKRAAEYLRINQQPGQC